jgi:hypothetical protein
MLRAPLSERFTLFENGCRGADGRWGRTTIRNIILSDTYLGTFWWGKEKRTTTTVSVVENGVRTYKKKVKRE